MSTVVVVPTEASQDSNHDCIHASTALLYAHEPYRSLLVDLRTEPSALYRIDALRLFLAFQIGTLVESTGWSEKEDQELRQPSTPSFLAVCHAHTVPWYDVVVR